MANPPKAKGTGAETELRKKLEKEGVEVRRTSAGSSFDLIRTGDVGEEPLRILATRPDKGEWLMTLSLKDWAWMVNFLSPGIPLHIEVKRYKAFSIHSIFKQKFGGG